MPNLRDAFTATTSRTVDLGNKTWDIAKGDTLRLRGRWVTGDGYTVRDLDRVGRDNPMLVLRGDGTKWTGKGTIVGSMPDNTKAFDPNREAQHAIRCDGLLDGEISGVHFSNIWGDAIYANKDSDGRWCKNLNIHDVSFDEIGRHAFTPNALDHGTLTRAVIGRVIMAIVDCEPPGKGWGCKHFEWTETLITDGGGGFVFANKGVGTSTSVHHITLDGIRCTRRPFSLTVNPPVGVRRQEFVVRNCSGIGPVYQPQLIFRHVDGVTIQNVDQPMASGPLVFTSPDCTRVSIT